MLNRKLHPHHVRLIVVVLDLGLGERGFLDDRPHDRLRAAIKLTRLRKLDDLARDLRLGRECHRRVGMRPVPLHAEPLELLALHVEPVLRERAALRPERLHRDGVLEVRLGLSLGHVLLLDLPLDREAVAVPARHVVRVVPEHLLRARDEILEDLVERVADVDVAIGVGRAIVEYEFGSSLGALAQLVVEAGFGPPLQHRGLHLREPGPHREWRFGQEQGFAPVARVGRRLGHWIASEAHAVRSGALGRAPSQL